MEFRLSETTPGTFEIVQFVPETVGTFRDRALAEKVLDFIRKDAGLPDGTLLTEPVIAPVPQPEAQPASSLKAPETPKRATRAPNIQQSETQYFGWTDAELAQAFQRLENGEKVKDIANEFGKSWGTLRGKWAAHKRLSLPKNPEPTTAALVPVSEPVLTPVEKITSAVQDLKDQDPCTICGKYFKPTPDSMEHCAACRQEF